MKVEIKKKVVLGGLPQKIHVKGENADNPVLLFLHGGPGVVNRHSVFTEHAELCNYFTVATWDQRGSGGSYYNAKPETLSVDRLVADAAELCEYLCGEFNKEKVFIIGGSWGSALGTLLANRYPERIAAYVGFGQFVNGEMNEKICYDFTLDAAKAAGDALSVSKLLRVGPPVKGVYKNGFDGMMVQRNIMMKYGGYSKNEGKQDYINAMVKPMLKSKEYTPSDLWGVLKGYKYVLKTMWNEVGALDFTKDATNFDVPFFVFDGRLDMNTPAELVEPWFRTINAPYKELIWFEESGHNPMNDEKEKFTALLIDRLLQIDDKRD